MSDRKLAGFNALTDDGELNIEGYLKFLEQNQPEVDGVKTFPIEWFDTLLLIKIYEMLKDITARGKEMKNMDRLVDYIDVDLLESFYLNQVHKTPTGKDLISVTLTEKLMLLEIYKKLCLGNNGTNNDADNTNDDSND